MDSIGIVALLWLASAAIAIFLGFLRGRAGDAVTLGGLLGPVGLVLVMFLSGPGGRQDQKRRQKGHEKASQSIATVDETKLNPLIRPVSSRIVIQRCRAPR